MNATKISALILSIIAAIFLLVGIVGSTLTRSFVLASEETTGVITSVSHAKERAYATYQVNGMIYESKLDAYTSGMHVGDSIRIFYNPSDPSSIATDSLMLVWQIMRYVGYGVLLIAMTLYLISKRGEEKRELLLATGKRLCCHVDEVQLVTTVQVGKRNPYRLICGYHDPSTGESRKFYSPLLWKDPKAGMTRETVDVCVDDYNEKKYAVDIASCGLDESYLSTATKARQTL